MAISPKCDKCGDELTDLGSLLLSPPDDYNKVVKFHLCKSCFVVLTKTFHKPDKSE